MKALILGGGFAGLAAASKLAASSKRGGVTSIRLVDRQSHNVFAPLLPDLISARVRPEHVRYPIERFCRRLGVAFTQASVERIIPEEGRVLTDQGALSADYLIICLGCETNYFGDEAMRSRSTGLKTVAEGLAIHGRISSLIDAARAGETRHDRPHVVVIGGGYTGFEIASHVARLIHVKAKLPFAALRDICRIMIVEKADDVLRNCSPKIREWGQRVIEGYGVEVRTGVTAAAPDERNAVRLSDDTLLPNAIVVWAVGVAPGSACAALDSPKASGGRLAVDEYLRLTNAPRCFAAGDVAGPLSPVDGKPLRMGVQFSLAAGARAAENVVRSLRGDPLLPFRPADLGYILPLAPGRAAGVILGHEMRGRLPSLLHYLMCAFRSRGWKSRIGLLRDLCDPRIA